MSVNTTTNITSAGGSVAAESTFYGLAAPTSTVGYKAGDEWHITPDGTGATAAGATHEWRFDGTKWVPNPSNPKTSAYTGERAPVLDFKTQAQIDALAAATPKPTDQASYIVTDGVHKGDIATYDAFNGVWRYYVPVAGDVTTVTNPDLSTNQGKWHYDPGTDTWIQETTTIPLPTPTDSSIGGLNIVFREDHNRNRNGSGMAGGVFIQNDSVLAFGTSIYHNGGEGGNNGGFPRKIPFLWSNLDVDQAAGTGTYSPVCTYVPKFTMVDYSRFNVMALDHLGKVWIEQVNSDISGSTTTATADVQSKTNPYYGLYPVKFFQARPDITVAKIYCQGVNQGLTGGVYTSFAAVDTTGRLWVTGYNGFGELGIGNRIARQQWIQNPITNVKSVAFVMRGMFILTAAGELYFTGQDQGGWLGALNAVYSSPQLVTTNVNNFDFTGYNATTLMAVKNDGTLWAGGLNPNGLQGRGNLTATTSFTAVPGITNAKTVFCDRHETGGVYSGIIRTDGTVSFAGQNRDGHHGYSLNASAVNNTLFITPTFAAQGTIVDAMATYGGTVLRTNAGAIWIAGMFETSGLGMPANTLWANKNMFRQVPLPEPVLAMEAGCTTPTFYSFYRLLTAVRGIINLGSAFGHYSNNNYNGDTNYGLTFAWHEMGDLRNWNTGISVVAPPALAITYTDSIRDLLSASQAAYDAAATDSWVEVTAAEYAALMGLTESAKSIATDAQMATTAASSVATNVTQAMSTANQVLTPVATYPVAVTFRTGTTAPATTAGMKLKYSTLNYNGYYAAVGGSFPNVAAPAANTQYYLVRKKPTTAIPTVGGWGAMYAPLANQLGRISGGSSNTGAGDIDLVSTATAFTPEFQVLTARIKNW
jgi:hypothetical protein